MSFLFLPSGRQEGVSTMSYIIMIITAIFVNNIVLAQFLGICPFLGVSKKVDTAGWMGLAVLFVMLIATLVTYPIYYGLLEPNGLGFMQTIVYILVIAALVQMVEIILKKSMPALYSALGVFLPLITTNCTILGVAINVINFEYNLGESIIYAIATALGFTLAMVFVNRLLSPRLLRQWRALLSLSSLPASSLWPSWASQALTRASVQFSVSDLYYRPIHSAAIHSLGSCRCVCFFLNV